MQEGKLIKQNNVIKQNNDYGKFDNFKLSVDSWIKKFNREVSVFKQYSGVIEENVENIEHNYELVKEMMNEIDSLRQEVKMLRVVQVAMLQKRIQ